MPHISIVVPVYHAEGCLEELYQRLRNSIQIITDDFEIFLVEDCGRDRSWQVIVDLAKRDSRVKGVQFSRNFGQHYGITAGLDRCNGDWVVVMDCDLQDRPEEIPQLYAMAQKVLTSFWRVAGNGVIRSSSAWPRPSTTGFLVIWRISNTMERVGNFRIMSRKVVENFRRMREQLRFFGGLVQWMGFPTACIEVEHAERFEGKSAYTFAKLWKLASETIIAHSDKPLRLAVRFGFLMAIFSFCYGIYILGHALFYGSVIPGWNSLIVSLYFIGGIIIGILGILGIYLGKTFDESKKRPLYIIRRATFDEKNSLIKATPWDTVAFGMPTWEVLEYSVGCPADRPFRLRGIILSRWIH